MAPSPQVARVSEVAFEIVLAEPFEAVVARCREELPREGFGILTEIDLQAKFREKLGEETPPNLILGACHPPSAFVAVGAVPEAAVFLPCNVVITVEPRGTIVRAMNPRGAMRLLDDPRLDRVAEEVAGRLLRALERVAA